MKGKSVLWIGLCLCMCRTMAQPADTLRMAGMRQKLEVVARQDSAWLDTIDLVSGRMSLQEVLQYMAQVGKVNLSVRADTAFAVACNFSGVRLMDVLLFLCREYHLELETTGNIVSVFPYCLPDVKTEEPAISFSEGKLSYDLRGNPLSRVVRKIAELTDLHLVVPGELYALPVKGYVRQMETEKALRTLAGVNKLEVCRNEEGIWTFGVPADAPAAPFYYRRSLPAGELSVDSLGRITAFIGNGRLGDILTAVCEKLGYSYFFLQPPDASVSVYVREAEPSDFFDVLLAGTPYAWNYQQGIYLFGTGGKDLALVNVKVIPLENRTADKVEELIPEALKKEVQIRLFPDQNSVIVSGERRRVDRIEHFLKEIDRKVALITIDVMIVDVMNSYTQETGVEAGLGNPPQKTTGTYSPGFDMSLNSVTINHLINSFNGFGAIRLGKVTPDFYLHLKFLEEAGTIQLHSTPKLSTLNGHEAVLSSGETRYYKEVMNNIIGSQNPMQSESYTWKDVEAKLSVRITPFVTCRNTITLDIEIEQSEFTEREEKDAPPGRSTRSFKSIIRVQNEETVLLGGIERNSRNKSSSGLPLIARIPLLKWLLGTSVNQKVKHKLNVFIKPTVVY